MQDKIVYGVFRVVLLVFLLSGVTRAADLTDLFSQVEKLSIERHGYVLGSALNPLQLKAAQENLIDAGTKGTFKFRDKNLYVVAQETSNRVLVIYEQFEAASQKKIQDLVGDLYMNFDDPTVLAHDQVIYWAYGKKGKISSKAFDSARKDKKTLEILATVKCISDIKIMEKLKGPSKGQVYYIISSDKILTFFGDQKT